MWGDFDKQIFSGARTTVVYLLFLRKLGPNETRQTKLCFIETGLFSVVQGWSLKRISVHVDPSDTFLRQD